MASSCKRSPHRHRHLHHRLRRCHEEQKNQHQSNRFTPKMHFSNRLVLAAAVVFVAAFMFPYHNSVLAKETTDVLQQVEFTTEHAIQISEIKNEVNESAELQTSNNASNSKNIEPELINIEPDIASLNETTQAHAFDIINQPDLSQKQLQPEVKNTISSDLDENSAYTPLDTGEINNEILSNVEESPDIRISPDFVHAHGENTVSTDNLEASIRNSVKTEIELEQKLESSPVLDILKELPEPEIRKTLTADIMSLDQQNFDESIMLAKVKEEAIEDTPESVPIIMESNMENQKIRDGRNLDVQQSEASINESLKEINTTSGLALDSHSFKADTIFDTKEEKSKQPKLIPEIENTSASLPENGSSIKNTDTKDSSIENTDTKDQMNLKVQDEAAVKVDSLSVSSSESSSLEVENSEELKNLEKSELNNLKNKSSASSSESNSSESSEEMVKEKENDSKLIENVDSRQKEEKPTADEIDLTIPKTSAELPSADNSESSDIAIFNTKESNNSETTDDTLSVVFNETLSATEANVDNSVPKENVTFNDEDEIVTSETKSDFISVILNEKLTPNLLNPGSALFSIANEDLEESTIVPEEHEHVVIKKVLDVQEIFEDISETTVVPFEQTGETNDVKNKLIEEQTVAVEPIEKQIVNDEVQHENKILLNTEKEESHEKEGSPEKRESSEKGKSPEKEETPTEDDNENSHTKSYPDEILENESTSENAGYVKSEIPPDDINSETRAGSEKEIENTSHSNDEYIVPIVPTSTTESTNVETTESSYNNLPSVVTPGVHHFESETKFNSEFNIEDAVSPEDFVHAKTVKGSRSVNHEIISSHFEDESAATLFRAYPPRDAGQTFNDNLADEYAGIGKALPVSITDGSNRSTIIIVLSSGTAFLFIVISVTIFLISFQRQHGTLDIEMQERSCGKDDLDEEDAETFVKLLEIELPPSVAVALDETEECL